MDLPKDFPSSSLGGIFQVLMKLLNAHIILSIFSRAEAVYLEKAGSELCWRIAEQCNEMSMSEEAIAGSSCLCGFEKQQLSEMETLNQRGATLGLGSYLHE